MGGGCTCAMEKRSSLNLSTLISNVRMRPVERVISSRTKGRRMREQVAEEMQTLMRHRTPDRRGCATLLALKGGRGGIRGQY